MISRMSSLRVVTYNIHKGVQGLGPASRLEIHNLQQAVRGLEADIICLQEVRGFNRQMQRRFSQWPAAGQADHLAPPGYQAIYRTNAVTRHGEHGNALLSRWPVLGHGHHDVSDHRFEQRGLLHVRLDVKGVPLHVVVVHLGLIHSSRERQVRQLGAMLEREVPLDEPVVVAGDFNDWGQRLHEAMAVFGLRTFEEIRHATYPARLPLLHLDRIYARGLRPLSAQVPHGSNWARLSDHLPLIAELAFE